MSNWLIQRSLRQNYFNLEIGLLISNTFQPYILNLFLIITTALEISLILTLFTKKEPRLFYYYQPLLLMLEFFYLWESIS